jgi:hypothetical protein
MWLLMPMTLSEYGHNESKNILARSLVVAGRILLMRLGADDIGYFSQNLSTKHNIPNFLKKSGI